MRYILCLIFLCCLACGGEAPTEELAQRERTESFTHTSTVVNWRCKDKDDCHSNPEER